MYVENVISKSFFGNLGLLLVFVASLYVLASYVYLGRQPIQSEVCLIADIGKYYTATKNLNTKKETYLHKC